GGAGYVATKLFHSLSYVKRLTVSDYSLKLLSCQGHLQTSLPSFCNLIHLEVNIGGWYLEYERGNKEQLLNFLHISPNLKSLIFAEGYRNYESYSNYGCSLDLVPRCLSLHLKSVEFRGFFGTELEMCLLELFLRNARVLRRVVIILSSELSKNWRNKKKVLNEIALFPRGSPECVLHVS
ncbi:hypothetical protein MKW94_008417, partial [Papaver nudicaule]|nr:hypothetical protein [Papaver nudicaule]